MGGETQKKGELQMLRFVMALLFGAFLFGGLSLAGSVQEAAAAEPPVPGGEPKEVQPQKAYGSIPLYFIENQGQKDKRVKFYAQGTGQTIYFTPESVYLTLSRRQKQAEGRGKDPEIQQQLREPVTKTVVRMTPQGRNRNVEIIGLEPQEGKINSYIGKDPGKWRTNIPTYRAVLYREAYPGIDLKFYGRGRLLEYDVIVKPGADPGRVRWQFAGTERLEVSPAGDLILHLPGGGRLVQHRPVVYQEIAGQRLPREGKYRLHRRGAALTCGFAVAAYDRRYPLIIDPIILDYSTFLGGSDWDIGQGIAVDRSDYAYVVGYTYSDDFPNRNAYQTFQGNQDVFVTRLAPAGNSLVYSTYLGGTGIDVGRAVAVDVHGNAYVTGYTNSDTFPIQNAYQGYQGGYNAFVTKIGPTGALLYSTCLGWGDARGYGIAVDGSGQAYVTGAAYAAFPTTEYAFQRVVRGAADAFVTKLAPAGDTLVYSTLLGGRDTDQGWAIALDNSGRAYVTGRTFSDNFPTTPYPYQNYMGKDDAFLTQLSPAGDSLVYSTWLGGEGSDRGTGIAVDSGGSAYVTGATNSYYFPTKNAFQNEVGFGWDAFVAKMGPVGSDLVYSTYLGGDGDDYAQGIAQVNGYAYVTGWTWSEDFPLHNAYQTHQGGEDAFVTMLGRGGNELQYSTYLGGYADDYGFGIALSTAGHAYVTGQTFSPNFPLQKPYMEYWGGCDVFVSKFMEQRKYNYPAMLLILLLN